MKGWLRTVPTFLIGTGVGAALGLFLAPRSGEKTRRLLKEKAQDGVDNVIARGKKVARRAQRAVGDAAREFVNNAGETAKSALQDAARNS
jgi:gas vesicle protein